MSLWEILRFALRGLGANKLRAMLTMLGVIIGVSAVIIITATVINKARVRRHLVKNSAALHVIRIYRPIWAR